MERDHIFAMEPISQLVLMWKFEAEFDVASLGFGQVIMAGKVCQRCGIHKSVLFLTLFLSNSSEKCNETRPNSCTEPIISI